MQPAENIPVKRWVNISVINLFIVALLGVIMRYKIAYFLPFVDQNNFLQAHSHFAFSGWIGQILMALLWRFLYNYLPTASLRKYKWLLNANLITSYGTLAAFIGTGDGMISTTFLALSIIVSWAFAVIFWIDLKKIKTKITSIYWFKAALLFSILSSFGALFLLYLEASNSQETTWFLASTYFYLHFQYNGWFFFACMGLLIEHIKSNIPVMLQNIVFRLFAFACVPAYFLSALWLPIASWVYILVVLAAVADLTAWIIMLKIFFTNTAATFKNLPTLTKWLFILSGTALSIKLLLQLCSIVPSLSTLAFGFRPVVIGYLHLMFLGVISLFIIGFCKMNHFLITSRAGNAGILIFVAGIILNEIFLMVQGLSFMSYISVPYLNKLLFGAAVCMFLGISLLITNLRKIQKIQ